jgi:2-C-methyl-D-erythritol 4-phosphate cytidylyltransferase/2-C-methyl-D-erythritol 2,4-cyclodiphosphate synthase
VVHVTAIIAAGGRGVRLGGPRPKQFLTLGGRPILQRSIDAFVASDRIADIVVALPPDLAAMRPGYLHDGGKPLQVVEGGERRQDSVANAFARVSSSADVVVIHDAARPLVTADLIRRTVDAAARYGAAIAALPVTDTVKRSDAERFILETIPRNEVFLAQTPQAFRVDVLRAALAQAHAGDATDEAMLAERAGHRVHLVEGDPRNLKITTAEDLATAEGLVAGDGVYGLQALRIGNGYDLHRLVAGRRLILGGVTIPFERGLQGHSDADVVCHAVTDAILGAAGAGDIGRYFPDTDAAWENADSLVLLSRAAAVVADAGFSIGNVDVVVIAQRPKLLPYVEQMRTNLARAMNVPVEQVSIKGKTNEGVDSMGVGDSIAAHAVALVRGSGVIFRGHSK